MGAFEPFPSKLYLDQGRGSILAFRLNLTGAESYPQLGSRILDAWEVQKNPLSPSAAWRRTPVPVRCWKMELVGYFSFLSPSRRGTLGEGLSWGGHIGWGGRGNQKAHSGDPLFGSMQKEGRRRKKQVRCEKDMMRSSSEKTRQMLEQKEHSKCMTIKHLLGHHLLLL